MNDGVEDAVNLCLDAKSRLQAIEDSNRELQKETRSLTVKYESLLEKNKKDSGIIMNLKDSESILQKAFETREEAEESLKEVGLCNKQKSLHRQLLQDERSKLLLKSQSVSNAISKISLKHQRIQEKIERQNKIGKEDRHRHEQEVQDLRSWLVEDRALLEEWIKTNAERDDALRTLMEDIKNGWKAYGKNKLNDLVVQEEADPSSSEIPEKRDKGQQGKTTPKESEETLESENECNPKEEAVRREWARKKILFEVAEKYRDHLMDTYMQLNNRQQDLSLAVVCAREWRIDKEAERKELIERVAKLEQLVTLKRRRKPIPPRTSNDELAIWIKVQQETNFILRDVLSKCLSIKRDEFESHSQFTKTFQGALKIELPLESESSVHILSEQSTEPDDPS